MNVIYRLDSVKKLTGLSGSTLWRLEKEGKFPKRIKISSRAVGWISSDIHCWINDHIPLIIPNKKTLKAMEDARNGKTHRAKNVDDLMEKLKG